MSSEPRVEKKRAVQGQVLVALSLLTFCSCPIAGAESTNKTEIASKPETSTKSQQNDKDAAKGSNLAAARQLNGTDKETNKNGVKVDASPDKKESAAKTADVVNQVPGVNVKKEDLEPPAQAPIKGFHPIKKLLQPVENLEGMSIKLEQQIMKLEAPIAALQPPMLSLQKKMTGVDDQIGTMQKRLDSMESQVTGVRSDLAGMRKEISELKSPIVSLQKPIAGVATPLEDLNTKLNYILMAILTAAVAISLGTPFAAIMVYRNRRKLFPGMSDHEMPKVVDGKEPVSQRR